MSNTTNRLSCILHHESNIPYCTNCLLACLAKHTGRDTQGVAIKETLVGGRVQEITGNEKAVTKVSYFKGTDKSQWKTNISAYDVVSLGEVYDGIELKLKAYGNNVEKLFCVKPDANPEQIQVKLSGVIDLRVNDEGQFVAETELGAVKFTTPVAYQEINGKRVDVNVEYRVGSSEAENKSSKHKTCNSKLMSSNPQSETLNLSPTSIGDPQLEYGFKVASYDKSHDLIIDPLLASTYLGGSGNEYGNSITLDTSGNVYVTGNTYSTDFPTTSGAYDTSYYGGDYADVFVSKLDSGLTSLLASTYLGGSGHDYGNSIALDTSGNVYVTGYTWSTDFPTTSGAYDTSYYGGDYADVFVSKLDSGLTSLLASTYLGGVW
ncbi:SBBP repeat-containing protein [Candidatus Kuenenia stuttgartiensis]|nr:SBBP repeat-containing protein [Candidatus Kuenenia stuttgartiensis]